MHVVFPALRTYSIPFDALNERDHLDSSYRVHIDTVSSKKLYPFIFAITLFNQALQYFLARIYLNKCSITCIFHILCKAENRVPA